MNRVPATTRAGSTPLARAFRLLEIVVEAGSPLAIAELAGRAEIPKPSVHRLVNHLISEGLLRSDTVHRGLVPGPRFAGLFCKAHAASWSGGPIRALMDTLVAEIRETCNLGVLDRDAVLYIERVECDWPIRIQLRAGSRVPLHATAIGKLLLAQLHTSARRQLLASIPRTAFTANTLTDADDLERACTEIRRCGYALNDGENSDSVSTSPARGPCCHAFRLRRRPWVRSWARRPPHMSSTSVERIVLHRVRTPLSVPYALSFGAVEAFDTVLVEKRLSSKSGRRRPPGRPTSSASPLTRPRGAAWISTSKRRSLRPRCSRHWRWRKVMSFWTTAANAVCPCWR